MPNIPLGVGAYSRPFAKLPEIRMENRFFEQNPLGAEQVALLSRPGTTLFLECGTGPIRALFTQPGVLGGDLFLVSGEKLYRYNGVDAPLEITGTVAGEGYPALTGLAIPGWEAVFITDGETLQYYEGEGRSSGVLGRTGAIANNDVVRIGDTYYKFTTAGVDVGAPVGTSGNPWLVATGVDDEASLQNLHDAINGGGTPGTTRSTALLAHPDVRARGFTKFYFSVYALESGSASDTIVTTETSAGMAWEAATLENGGGNELKEIEVPDGLAVVDLATLASFVICAVGNSQKFFWIRPGEITIDALDFSSAESEPDYIVGIGVVGDTLWILGQSSIEPWYASGDGDQPFLPQQGRVFLQGVFQGTFAKSQDRIFFVGRDMVAYLIEGAPQRISHHGMEEIFRRWQVV